MNRSSKLGRKPLRFVTLDLRYDKPHHETLIIYCIRLSISWLFE